MIGAKRLNLRHHHSLSSPFPHPLLLPSSTIKNCCSRVYLFRAGSFVHCFACDSRNHTSHPDQTANLCKRHAHTPNRNWQDGFLRDDPRIYCVHYTALLPVRPGACRLWPLWSRSRPRAQGRQIHRWQMGKSSPAQPCYIIPRSSTTCCYPHLGDPDMAE